MFCFFSEKPQVVDWLICYLICLCTHINNKHNLYSKRKKNYNINECKTLEQRGEIRVSLKLYCPGRVNVSNKIQHSFSSLFMCSRRLICLFLENNQKDAHSIQNLSTVQSVCNIILILNQSQLIALQNLFKNIIYDHPFILIYDQLNLKIKISNNVNIRINIDHIIIIIGK